MLFFVVFFLKIFSFFFWGQPAYEDCIFVFTIVKSTVPPPKLSCPGGRDKGGKDPSGRRTFYARDHNQTAPQTLSPDLGKFITSKQTPRFVHVYKVQQVDRLTPCTLERSSLHFLKSRSSSSCTLGALIWDDLGQRENFEDNMRRCIKGTSHNKKNLLWPFWRTMVLLT